MTRKIESISARRILLVPLCVLRLTGGVCGCRIVAKQCRTLGHYLSPGSDLCWGDIVDWYVYLAYFSAGGFLANGVPHFIHGVSGKRFQSPFASPPGVGESGPLANAIWGFANISAAYVLISGVGDFSFGLTRPALMVGLGAFVTAALLAIYFGRIRRA